MDDRQPAPKTILSLATLVPISFIMTFIGVLVGGIFWASNLFNASKAQAKSIEMLEKKITAVELYNSTINDRLARIETKVDILIQATKN